MKTKKVLFVASVIEHITTFHIPYLQWFNKQGFEVHVAAQGEHGFNSDAIDVFYDIDFCRSPYSLQNISAYKKLKQILDASYYELVHCHTPMAAALTRLAAKEARKRGTKVVYTAHGFHFFKNGPKSGWLIYFPVEKFLAKYTDAIITINKEDYESLFEYHFNCPGKYLVPGIGVNTANVIISTPLVKNELRKTYNYRQDDFILFYAAEFIPRKNHELIIKALPKLTKVIPNIKVLFAGRGELRDNLKKLASQLNVKQSIDFVGYRDDISKLAALSDIGISSSRQEGLGITVAEDMFAGLPVVVTRDRGHCEMVIDKYNGYLFEQENVGEFTEKIIKLYQSPSLRSEMAKHAIESIQKFSIENSLKEHIIIYNSILGNYK